MREAQIQARLEHPAIVPVHEIGRDGNGQPFFTMKRLVGVTLKAVLAAEAAPDRSNACCVRSPTSAVRFRSRTRAA